MAQKCIVVGRRNPGKPTEPAKYYAQAKSNRNVTIDEICKRVSERSSYSRGELVGCIAEYLIEVLHVLEEGNIAEMGVLGNFSLTARTATPTDKPEDFRATNIGGAKVRFYPGEELRNLCKTVPFEIMRDAPGTDDGEDSTTKPGGDGGDGEL